MGFSPSTNERGDEFPRSHRVSARSIEYLTPIAAKYDRARKEPWIDVPPDPPFPVAGPPVLPWR